jgi:arylsulfatase A-like enzyme
MRVPCIVRWPGRVPAGRVCDELCSSLDLLPTLAAWAGAPLPPQKIDGHDIRPLLLDQPQARSPWDDEGFFYYFMDQLQAVRAGRWKLYLPLAQKYVNLARRSQPSAMELYDVRSDVGEMREVSAEHPDVVARLQAMADKARQELGDVDRVGRGQRPAGRVEHPQPLMLLGN